MKIRVHELAKKYGFGNKEFLDILNNIGIDVHSHLAWSFCFSSNE